MKYYKKSLRKAKKRCNSKTVASLSDYTLYRIYKELVSIFSQFTFTEFKMAPEYIEADLTIVGKPNDMEEISQKINSGDFLYLKKSETKDHFLNIYLDHKKVFDSVLKTVIDLSNKYGTNNQYKNHLVLIEYSSPNIAKSIGIGHFRATIIGQVLSNIYEANGYIVLRDNYLGDWGTQFGKIIYAYQNWGQNMDINIENLKLLYIKFQKEFENNKNLIKEARRILRKLENGDKKLIALWKKIRSISIKEFKYIYKILNVEFDCYGGESFFLEKAHKIANDCFNRKICKKGEDGAIIVNIENLPTFILQKGNNSTIYYSRDLAQLKTRVDELNPDEVLYVVGDEQKLHFEQLFALARKLNYLNNTIPKHIGFGLVLGENGKKMSTRHGTTVDLNGLINKSIYKSLEVINKKNPEFTEKQKKEIAKKIGVGAMIYNDVSQTRNKDIVFDWDRMLNFEAGSATYLQYTYVRINSIMEQYKIKFGKIKKIKDFNFEKNIEVQLSKKIMFFPQIINISKKTDSPHLIAGYLEDLAGLFNTFYNKISIIETKETNLRISRLILAKSVGQVIENGLRILNISIPEKM